MRLVPEVYSVVYREVNFACEALSALETLVFVPLFAVLPSYVILQIVCHRKTYVALTAGKRLFPRVSSAVNLELTLPYEAFPALKARVGASFRAVHPFHVHPQIV